MEDKNTKKIIQKKETKKAKEDVSKYKKNSATSSLLNVVKPTFLKQKQTKKAENLKIISLGGVGEIGKNMTAIQYKDEIIVIDCGLGFPNDDMLGIDMVIPDFSYLVENKSKVKALIVTHAHEDHIGAIPHFLKEVSCPVYGGKFCLELIDSKLSEHKGVKLKGFVCKPKQQVQIGCFNIEFVHVTHSTADCFALAISTPVGLIVHSGDFKVDYTPVNTQPIDLARFAELGKKGVLAFLCESTNVQKKGHSMSESVVSKTLMEVFEAQKGRRIIVATFASNAYRLHQIMLAAEKYGRKVAFTGRSMLSVSECAAKCGLITLNKENVIDIKKITNYPDGELCIITTGSQGQASTGLARMARGEFKNLEIGDNDTVIFSSKPISGNEKVVNNIINSLYKKGATVIDNELEEIHASGHACADEIKLLHSLVKPKYFIPVHGEYIHLIKHKELAIALGMDEKNILIPEIGRVIEVNQKVLKYGATVPAGEMLVDGTGLGQTDSNVLRERKQLSEEGVCVCIVGLDKSSGEITLGPDIIARGLIYSEEIQTLVYGAKEAVIDLIENTEIKTLETSEIRNLIKKRISSYFFKTTERKPLVLTIIIES